MADFQQILSTKFRFAKFLQNMETADHTTTNPGASILVIEAAASRREHLRTVFTRRGWGVIAVPSSEHAMATLKHHRPRVILADVMRLHAGGRDFVEQIRAFDAHVAILLIGNGQLPRSKDPLIPQTQALLPADVSDETLVHEVDRWLSAPQPTTPERWPGTILVVDDEPKLRAVLQDYLQRHGFSVQTAASGTDALNQLARCSPTMVLLDIKMPGMDGLATLKRLKAAHRDLPVIMTTGVEDEALMAKALALGAADYLTKPFNLEYLELTLLSKMLTEPTS